MRTPEVPVFEIVRAPAEQPGAPTMGALLIEGIPFAATLEPPWLDNRPGLSCIPEGTYPVRVTFSNRFRRMLPEFFDVPGRSAVRAHSGDGPGDTEGCVLLGMGRTPHEFAASDSGSTVRRFLAWLHSVGNEARVTIRTRTDADPDAPRA